MVTPKAAPSTATSAVMQSPVVGSNRISSLPAMIGEQELAYNYTNGIRFVENNQRLAMNNVGEILSFIQEPTNEEDSHTIAIYLKGTKLGYVYHDQTQAMINGWIKRGDYFIGYISGYHDNIVEYDIGFYKLGGRTASNRQDSSLRSQKVNIFTKKWSSACSKCCVTLDFETTGFSANNDRIVEVAAIKYENGVETDKLVSLVNPERKIPKSSIAVHHITDDMVQDAPIEKDIIPKLVEFLSDSLLVGHNLNFDLRFLEAAAARNNLDVQYNYIDALDISRKLFPELENHKLGTVSEHIGFKAENMHRAETDVRACAEIIKYALNYYEQANE